MSSFLWYIGWYNVVGSLALVFALRPKLAEKLLVQVFQVVIAPYSHGTHGRMWIWWAMTSNLGLGIIMVQAASWPHEVQQGVTAAVIVVYAIMAIVLVAATQIPARWRAYGLWSTLVLWIAQIGWAAYGLATS
jgi:hypothetical protein